MLVSVQNADYPHRVLEYGMQCLSCHAHSTYSREDAGEILSLKASASSPRHEGTPASGRQAWSPEAAIHSLNRYFSFNSFTNVCMPLGHRLLVVITVEGPKDEAHYTTTRINTKAVQMKSPDMVCWK